MDVHPVQLRVEPSRHARVHVVIRLAILAAWETLGCASLYWALYIALPAISAVLLLRDGPERFLQRDGLRAVRVLRWLACAYAYLWSVTDAPPDAKPNGAVDLKIEIGGRPTPQSALLRLLTSIPAGLVLVVLSIVAAVLWVVGALAVLFTESMPSSIADFIAMKLRYQFQLAAYHLSLVDAYPTLASSPLAGARESGET